MKASIGLVSVMKAIRKQYKQQTSFAWCDLAVGVVVRSSDGIPEKGLGRTARHHWGFHTPWIQGAPQQSS